MVNKENYNSMWFTYYPRRPDGNFLVIINATQLDSPYAPYEMYYSEVPLINAPLDYKILLDIFPKSDIHFSNGHAGSINVVAFWLYQRCRLSDGASLLVNEATYEKYKESFSYYEGTRYQVTKTEDIPDNIMVLYLQGNLKEDQKRRLGASFYNDGNRHALHPDIANMGYVMYIDQTGELDSTIRRD